MKKTTALFIKKVEEQLLHNLTLLHDARHHAEEFLSCFVAIMFDTLRANIEPDTDSL